MKKITALITLIASAVSFSAYAAPSEKDFKNAINEPITYADIKMEISTDTSELSEEVKEFLALEENTPQKSSLIYDISIKTSEDLKKIQAAAKYKMVYEGSPELDTYETGQYLSINYYGNRPIFINVLKHPQQNQYIHYNLADVADLQPFVNELGEKISSGKYSSIENIFGSTTKAKVEKGKYVFSLNDKEFKAYLPTFIENIGPIFSTSTNYSGSEFGNEYKEIHDMIKNVQLLGKKGFRSELTLDSDKKIDTLKIELDLDANLYMLYTSLGADFSNTGLDEKNLQYKAFITVNIDFDNINADKEIAFPPISTVNTYNYTNDLVQQHFRYTLEQNKVNVYSNYAKVYFEDAEPVIENGRTLVPLRKFLNSIGVKDEDIVYNDGYITINYKNRKTVELNVFDTNASVTANGATTPILLDVSAKMVNDRTLVPLRFLSETFECEVEYQELDETTSFISVIQDY